MNMVSKNSGRWSIKDPVIAKDMHGVIGGISTLMVFPHKAHSEAEKETQSKTEGPVKMYQVESFSWLWSRQARKLINESVGTYLSLQAAVKEAEPDECKPLLVKKCREYRSMIQACVEDVNMSQECEDQEEIKACGQLLYKMELILSLIEILFIDIKPGGLVLGQLVMWIRVHFTQCIEKKNEAMESDHPHLHPAYWEAVYGAVLQGRMEGARQMLSNHSNADTDPFLSMDELLRKMPVYQVYGGVSVAEFTVRWQHWQSECERRLQEGHFTTCHQLQTVCKILCGNQQTINSLIDLMDTWYHLMVSTLLFTCPTVKLFRLHNAAQDAITSIGGEQRTTPLDNVLLAAMEADTHQVIKECQQVLDNTWFTAHVTDLLCHTMGQKTGQKFLPELRESLLLDYASVLVSHSSLWQVGILYLDHCGASGIAMSQMVLQRLPLTDDSCVHKIIQMASDRNFDSIIVGVCRIMGRRALSQGRLGSAIWWGVRSRDAAFTSHLAHQILHKYVAEGRFESSQLLDHLGPAMLLSDTLTFLGKYREFHMMYQDGNFQDAATLLVSLISSKLAPEYFWPVLLLDALPLLKSEEPVISAEQTYELMYCLHNLHNHTCKRIILPSTQPESSEDGSTNSQTYNFWSGRAKGVIQPQ
ncbi:nuclear pore complex protein Nup85-like isoform X2 [Homarus americanus]|uniref:nuclear pore complex protein Nup85-like isoform X2 n=1 Tax=Homarus americanus TaxID=6706 RepID=UPI001C4656CD|nr:nuclear pore complex protein Nup85-like isoform X2 [Homarus americanus]